MPILTVLESKGLEFNDVLLYDFFSDSPASRQQWKVGGNSGIEGNSGLGVRPVKEVEDGVLVLLC